jgi:2-methylisocitrate lyase-like PEP mutase family enzyme
MDPLLSTLETHSKLLRSLHVPGEPLVLPNAWDVATAKAVVAAGFPVVATTSGGVAASLGYEDHEGAPPEEMLAAAARIGRAVDAPLNVDAEAGYGMAPAELVDALRSAGAAGCNLEDTNHATGALADPEEHADWLRRVREAASERGYPLVINARIDVFLDAYGRAASYGNGAQIDLVADALERAHMYLGAGADCVYPIALWEEDALGAFVGHVPAPVNILPIPRAPSVAELAELGVARISHASLLYRQTMEGFADALRALPNQGAKLAGKPGGR